eukprot:1567791-Pyramimonas_sp.AAC.2
MGCDLRYESTPYRRGVRLYVTSLTTWSPHLCHTRVVISAKSSYKYMPSLVSYERRERAFQGPNLDSIRVKTRSIRLYPTLCSYPQHQSLPRNNAHNTPTRPQHKREGKYTAQLLLGAFSSPFSLKRMHCVVAHKRPHTNGGSGAVRHATPVARRVSPRTRRRTQQPTAS